MAQQLGRGMAVAFSPDHVIPRTSLRTRLLGGESNVIERGHGYKKICKSNSVVCFCLFV